MKQVPNKTMTDINSGILRRLYYKLLKGNDQRTVKAKRNIIGSSVIKIVTIICTFVTYPLVVNYLNTTRYGIFLTLSSVLSWMMLLDIGFGNGLKNKLTESIASKQFQLARQYVSSTYLLLCYILLGIVIVFIIINPLLHWDTLLNVPPEYSYELNILVWIIFLGVGLSFLLRLLTSILYAYQMPAMVAFLDMLGQIFALLGLYILIQYKESSLIYAASIICFMPVLVYAVASVYFFKTKFKKISPAFHCINLKLSKSLINLGFKFFIATISSLFLFQTTNFLISYFSGPSDVTFYNIAYKLLGLGYTLIMIIATPYWSAFSEAYTLKDFTWMKKSFKRLKISYLSITLGNFILLWLSPWIINIWMGEIIKVPYSILFSVFIYTNLISWLTICIYPINGIGKVKLQFTSSVLEIIFIIPAAFVFGYFWGTPGIILAPVAVSIPRAIWAPLQLNKLLKEKAKGIWVK